MEKTPKVIAQRDSDSLRAEVLASDVNELPTGYYQSFRIIFTFLGISLSLMGVYFAFEGSAAAVTYINADIGPSDNSSLFSTVWTVATSICVLLFGRLSDRFGRRNFIIYGNIIGIIGAIIACTAKTFNTLIGAQVLLGIAAGPPSSYPLLAGELMSNRMKYFGAVCIALPNVIGTGFSAYLGQRLAITASWRWIFYINIIMIGTATILLFIFYHPPSFTQLHGRRTRKRDELKKLDIIGIFLLTAGLALFLLGVSWGGSPQPWNSPNILGLLISGAVTCVIFVLYECFATIECPIVPMRLFRDIRGFACLTAIACVMGVMNIALFILWPQQITYIFGSTLHNWEHVAWLGSAPSFGIWAGIVLLGSVFHKIGHIRWQLTAGSIWTTAFLGAMASVDRNSEVSAIVFSVFIGLAIGWAEVVTMIVVQFIASDQELGIAYAVVAALRTVFASIFTAAFTAVYTNKVPGEIKSKVVPAVLNAGLPQSSLNELLTAAVSGSQQEIAKVPGMNSTIIAVTNNAVADSYATAYSYVYYFAMGLGCIAIIASASCMDFDHYLNSHVPHQIYHRKDAEIDPLETGSYDSSDADTSNAPSEFKV